ncbi:hypothetical protein MNEG_2662, partial [Monoraphidium neglectum]
GAAQGAASAAEGAVLEGAEGLAHAAETLKGAISHLSDQMTSWAQHHAPAPHLRGGRDEPGTEGAPGGWAGYEEAAEKLAAAEKLIEDVRGALATSGGPAGRRGHADGGLPLHVLLPV